MITALVFKKNDNFVAENWWKTPKIVIKWKIDPWPPDTVCQPNQDDSLLWLWPKQDAYILSRVLSSCDKILTDFCVWLAAQVNAHKALFVLVGTTQGLKCIFQLIRKKRTASDRLCQTTFWPKTFRINFHPQILDKFPSKTNIYVFHTYFKSLWGHIWKLKFNQIRL
jgi:hypothetical protein